jgi:hypothetical protein
MKPTTNGDPTKAQKLEKDVEVEADEGEADGDDLDSPTVVKVDTCQEGFTADKRKR